MNAAFASARSHPFAIASIVVAGIAVTACALVAIAYMLGWIPSRAAQPAAALATAPPPVRAAASGPGLDLLPGETLVAPADAPRPTTPSYAKPAESSKTAEPLKPAAAPRKAPPPIYSQTAPPPSSTTVAQVLPSRAAPSKPNYNRGGVPYTSYERSSRELCVNCGVIASIAPSGDDWEVRVRFDDGSGETLSYPQRPRLRSGERVRLEDGRLVRE
jgi:hypothetical protein